MKLGWNLILKKFLKNSCSARTALECGKAQLLGVGIKHLQVKDTKRPQLSITFQRLQIQS